MAGLGELLENLFRQSQYQRGSEGQLIQKPSAQNLLGEAIPAPTPQHSPNFSAEQLPGVDYNVLQPDDLYGVGLSAIPGALYRGARTPIKSLMNDTFLHMVSGRANRNMGRKGFDKLSTDPDVVGLGVHFGGPKEANTIGVGSLRPEDIPKVKLMQRRAGLKTGDIEGQPVDGAFARAYKLGARKPLFTTDTVWEQPLHAYTSVLDALKKAGKIDAEDYTRKLRGFKVKYDTGIHGAVDPYREKDAYNDIRKLVERHGFDSIGYKNVTEGPTKNPRHSFMVWKDELIEEMPIGGLGNLFKDERKRK